jgi:hypothetical protein
MKSLLHAAVLPTKKQTEAFWPESQKRVSLRKYPIMKFLLREKMWW